MLITILLMLFIMSCIDLKDTFTEINRLGSFLACRKILIGQDSIHSVGIEAKKLGAGRVMVVTVRGVAGAGLIDRILEPLKKSGIAYEVFDEVLRNHLRAS